MRKTLLLTSLWMILKSVEASFELQDAKIGADKAREVARFFNEMKETDPEFLLNLLKIGGDSNSLSEFLVSAWERLLRFEFHSSYPSFHSMCRGSGDERRRRRLGVILEASTRNERNGRLETNKWLLFLVPDGEIEGFHVDYLKDLGPSFEGSGEDVPEIVADSEYECRKDSPDQDFEDVEREIRIGVEIEGRRREEVVFIH